MAAGEASPPPGQGSAVFPRDGDSIPLALIQTLVREDLDSRGYAGERVDTWPEPPGDIALLDGETAFRVTSPSPGIRPGPVSFYVEVLAGTRVSRVVPLTVWVQLFRSLAVTRRPIARGETLVAGDVGLQRVEVNAAGDDGFDAVEPCLGLRARRSLPAGWVLNARDLEKVPAVRRGQKLSVLYRQGAIAARAMVEVKSDAWLGDAVPVMNVDSRRAFTARVAGPGLLEVTAP
jgi:flagella basal body P-ring formation protein FlgA